MKFGDEYCLRINGLKFIPAEFSFDSQEFKVAINDNL